MKSLTSIMKETRKTSQRRVSDAWSLRFGEWREEPADSFAVRSDAAVEDEGVDLGDKCNVDLHDLDARRHAPDVTEGDAGKLTSPAGSNADATEGGTDDVAQGLPQVEALVAELPHTVDALGVIGFTDGLFECNLKS